MEKNYRKTLFIHLQGIVLIPILHALFSSKIINLLFEKHKIKLDDLKNEKMNIGYIHVAFRN